MAILVEEQKARDSGMTTAIIFGMVLLALIAAVYFVFFSPAPLVENALPSDISQIQNINLNASPLNNYSVFSMITATSGIGTPNVGVTGRDNPFQPF